MKRLAEVKDSLDIEVKQNFIDPLQNLCDKDLKEIQVNGTTFSLLFISSGPGPFWLLVHLTTCSITVGNRWTYTDTSPVPLHFAHFLSPHSLGFPPLLSALSATAPAPEQLLKLGCRCECSFTYCALWRMLWEDVPTVPGCLRLVLCAVRSW